MEESTNQRQFIFNRIRKVSRLAVIVFVSSALFLGAFSSVLAVSISNISLGEPVQSCLVSNRVVSLAWTADINGNPTYHILRRLSGEADYAEIGNTTNLFYNDNSALSDKNYFYQIKAVKGSDIFSNEVLASANYCPPVFSSLASLCQNEGPHNSLAWSGVSGDLSKYEILRKNVTAGDLIFSKVGETNNTVYDDSLNIIGTNDYSYAIRAIWQNESAIDSASGNVTAFVCPPFLAVNSGCNNNSPGGPEVALSWSNLLGVERYEIYRKAQSEESYILLALVDSSITTYKDNLVTSLSLSYWEGEDISYFVKAVWIKDAVEISQSSLIHNIVISRCSPFVTVQSVCDAYNNPEMHISWTRTIGADLYNLYRDNTVFLGQISGAKNSYVDYLNSLACPGGICTHTYRVEASVAGFPNFISKPEPPLPQNIDCATITPPSPAPEITAVTPDAYCESGKSKIYIEWLPSANVIYYTLYRDGQALINLSNTSFIDAGVESGINYAYSVRAFGRSGTSTAMSDAKDILAVSCVPPAVPNLSLAKSCSANMPLVNLSWSVSTANNITSYEIKRGLSVESLSTLAIVGKTVNSKVDNESVNPLTAYYYQIIANSVTGVDPSSSFVKTITTGSCLPATPAVTLSTYCASDNAKIKVYWTSTNVNTDHFEIFREDVSGGLVPIATVSLAGTSYTWIDSDSGITQLSPYKYKVVAVGQLSSKISTQGYKSITTYNCALPGAFTLNDPPNVYCQGSYPRSDLNWTASSNSASYNLFRNLLDPPAGTTTFTNVVSPYTDRGFGNALKFDGLDDYVSLFNLAIDTSPNGKNTVEFWMNWSGQNNVMPFGWNTGYDLWFYNDCFGFNTNNNNIYGISSSGLANNLVHAVAIFNNGSNTANSLYINGVKQSIFTCRNEAGSNFATPDFFVSGWGYGGYYFSGIIDEVRIYNRALSDIEAAEHYQGIYPATETNLIGLWHFDEGSGLLASDSTNRGNDGVLSNGPLWVQNGLQSQAKYSWQAIANGAGGATLSNTTAPAIMPVCQTAKPGLVLSSFCQGGTGAAVTLRWSYAINAFQYEIYRDGAWIKTINQTDPEFSSRTWVDNNSGLGLNQEATYSYYIKAIGPTGLINSSDSILITTPSCALPAKPENFTANFICDGSYPRVNLSWEASANATGYSIYRNINGGSYILLMTIPNTSYVDAYPAINVNITYSYYVVATGPGGSSILPSDLSSIPSGQYCAPSIPVIDSISTSCESNMPVNTVSWIDDTDFNTANYEIYRAAASDLTSIFNFENVLFPPEGGTTGGSASWSRDNTVASEGVASAASGTIGDNESTYLDYNITISESSTLSFFWRTSSEANYDYLFFCLDNDFCTSDAGYNERISGIIPFSQVIVPLSAGAHSLRWVYSKDVGAVSGSDKGWVDNILIISDAKIASALKLQTVNKGILSWPDNIGLAPSADYAYWVKAIGPTGLTSSFLSLSSVATYACVRPVAPNISLSNICSSYNDPITVLNWNKTLNTTSYNLYKNGALLQSIAPGNDSYLKKWLIIGGFSYTGTDYAAILDNDYLEGEANVKPRAGKSFGGKTWFEYNSPENYIDFMLTSAPMSALTPKTYAVSYAFSYIYSAIAQSAQLRIGSNNGVKVYVNGTAIYTNTAQRSAFPDQDIKNINLIAGINTLLVKVQQGGGEWGLYARITDASGNDLLGDVTFWDSQAITDFNEDYNVSSVGPGGISNPASNIASSAPLDCNPLTPDLTLIPGCNGPNTQITLSWPSDSNTYYWNIYKKRSSDAGYVLLNPPGNITNSSYVDMNTASNVSYDYYVVAYGSGGINRTSDLKTAVVLPCYDAPIKPIISAEPQCAGVTSRIKINWAPYDSTKTLSFNIYRKNITAGDSDFTKIFTNLPSWATEFSDGGIVAGDDYQYRVEAVGSGANNSVLSDVSLSSETIAIDCLNIPPFNPPSVSLNYANYTITSGGEVSLQWTDAQNETKYKVFRRNKGEAIFAYQKQNGWINYFKKFFIKTSYADYDNPVITMLPSADPSPCSLPSCVNYTDSPASGFINYIDRTAGENIEYEYQVVALNNAGGVDAGITYSNIISPVYVPIAPPIAPILSSLSILGPNKVELQWTRPILPADEYTNIGNPPLYEIQKSFVSDFSTYTILGTKCLNIIYSGLARACETRVADEELSYVDSSASYVVSYYRIMSENYGGKEFSNIISGSAMVKWREVAPK